MQHRQVMVMRTATLAPRSDRLARFVRALPLAATLALVSLAPAMASPSSFVNDLWPEARSRGVSRAIYDAALANFSPDQEVLSLTQRQPEVNSTVGDYVEGRVTSTRINTGRQKHAEWSRTLSAIEQRWGVQAEVVLSIWGMETNFGSFMGGNNTVEALATLTYGGYRTSFFKNELLTALEILTAGHISPREMVGSWAGAMGHTQFMPSSFTRYAVDFTGDGRRDIWTTIPDALASTANYLKEHGWRPGETWGYEVDLPAGFDFAAAQANPERSLGEWRSAGVTRTGGRNFPRAADTGRFYMPEGGDGPVFVVLHNFDVIKRYNNSSSYALSVGHLADRILGVGPFVHGWSSDDALSTAQRRDLQSLLNRRGFDAGTVDGVMGPRTRAAIMAYQKNVGMMADGHPDASLLARLR